VSEYDENKLKLLAWYISEGNVHMPYETRISQLREHYREEISDLIKSFKNTLTTTERYLSLSDRNMAKWLSENAGSGAYNKKIPEYVFGLDLSGRILFQKTLMKGDGDKDRNRYTTSSRELAEGFARLCLLNGQSVYLRQENENLYRVYFGRKTRYCIKTKEHIKKLDKKIPVYDITATKNHIIFAGRNGKFNWIGQCFGPRETWRYVIPEIIEQLSKAPVLYLGNVLAQRDFTYVTDGARALVDVMECRELNGEVVNCGTGVTWSIESIAEQLSDIFYPDEPVKTYIDSSRLRPWDVDRLICDASKLREYTGWKPEIAFNAGLKKTVEWFRENGSKWDFREMK